MIYDQQHSHKKTCTYLQQHRKLLGKILLPQNIGIIHLTLVIRTCLIHTRRKIILRQRLLEHACDESGAGLLGGGCQFVEMSVAHLDLVLKAGAIVVLGECFETVFELREG